ncbi:MAG: SRPBCC domain-containing protein [Sphingobacteriia bacterium]|nr:SRPBCC domain-containing protein [Sphingobacteriia bacterium]
MDKRIKTEIIINASKEKLWVLLTNFNGYPNWNPFIRSIEGELKQGGRLKNTLQNGEKIMVFKPIVLEVVPFHSFSWLGSLWVKGLFDGRHYFCIEEIAPNQVKLIHGEDFSGILSTAILKQVGEDTRKNFVDMNQALKQLAESDSTFGH